MLVVSCFMWSGALDRPSVFFIIFRNASSIADD